METRQPLGAMVRKRLAVLFDDLGPQRVGGLYRRVMEEVERALLLEVLERTHGSQTAAAKILGIHRNTLRLRLRSLGL